VIIGTLSSPDEHIENGSPDMGASSTRADLSHASGAHAPRWLVALVIVLAVAVVGLGVLVARGAVLKGRQRTGGDLRLGLLEEGVQARPNDLALRRQLAFAYQLAGRDDDALREYDAVLSEDPRDLAALYNKGLVTLSAGRRAEGERILLRVLELAPSHSLAAKALGELYVESAQFERVVDVVVPAADAHPGLADLQYLAGLGYENTRRPLEAEERYGRALSLMPDLTEAQRGLERVRQ